MGDGQSGQRTGPPVGRRPDPAGQRAGDRLRHGGRRHLPGARGFEVTAVDDSPTAIERARVRADMEDVLPRFVLADIFEFAPTAGQFDFIYNAGFYHYIRRIDLDRYLNVLWRVTRPGSLYLTLAGARGEEVEADAPQLSKRQLYNDLGRLFEVVRLEHCRLDSPRSKAGYPAWSCLMQRPAQQRP